MHTDPRYHLKGRIAEALVEGMLMRAGYAVTRAGRESQMPRLLKTGKDEFLPDFMITRPVERPGSDSTVSEYSHLARKLFALLAESRAAETTTRLG